MALNLDGDDITSALGGGGPSPSDPAQDAKIADVENKTQNINLAGTDGTKTTFNNNVVAPVVEAPEVTQGANLFYVYNNDFTGSQVNNKDNSIPKFDTDGKKIQHSNFFITDDNNYGSVLSNQDLNGSANCFFGINQVASGFTNVHIGKNITGGNNLNNQNVLIGSNLKGGNGQNNISIGTLAGPNVDGTNNQQNINIGWGSGNSVNSGANNIFLGEQANTNNDSSQGIGIGKSALIRRNEETVLSTTIIRPNVDNVCDLGTPSNDPLHVSRFKNLYLSGNTNNINTISSGYVQAPIISATTELSTEKITNFDSPTPTTAITIAPTTGIITVHKDILPISGNTLNFGTDTAGGRFNNIASQTIILNDKGQSNKYYNQNGSAGIDIGTGSVGAINLTGSKYQNHNNSIVTLNGSGQIQQPSDNATIDGNGNATFKNLELLNIASSGVIKAKEIQSNDAANTLSLLNRATIAGKGIIIDATTNGNIQFTGDSYVGDANRLIRLNTNGTIEKLPLICDGPTNDNLSGINTLSTTTMASSNILNSANLFTPNIFLGTFLGNNTTAGILNLNSGNVSNSGNIAPVDDNLRDIGTLSLAYKDIHIKGDVYKNGVVYSTGGGGGVNGISSVDNGGGDIEISFTGTDYKTNGYLSIDTNGRIQVTPTIQVSNAEYDAIVTKWLQERPSPDLSLVKIYLPQGVSPGNFNHVLHPVYIFTKNLIGNSRSIAEVRFKGYLENGVPRTTTYFVQVPNVVNSIEIYNLTSQGHPNNIANTNEKQHIINHFLSDYNYDNFNSVAVTQVVRVAVLTGDVNNWDHTKPFFVSFDISPSVSPQQSGIVTLYGSQNGLTVTNASASYGTIPSGYSEIF